MNLQEMLGLWALVASGCTLFVVACIFRHMENRWLKIGIVGSFLCTSAGMGFRGMRLLFGIYPSEPFLLILLLLYSTSMILIFLCFTGHLNGHGKSEGIHIENQNQNQK